MSIVLVTSYLRLVHGVRFALLYAGSAQLVFLVLFSYAFFFKGYTGLTVTVGAILTLFILMQQTGEQDWEAAFRRRARPGLDNGPARGSKRGARTGGFLAGISKAVIESADL